MCAVAFASVLLCASASSASAAEDGQISGRVISAVTKAPIEGVEPCAAAVPVTELPGTCTLTNANGEYTISSLPPGEYIITFVVHNPRYDYQYYNHKYDYSEAEPVVVEANQTTAGIEGELGEVGGSVDGELAGRVTNASTKAAIEGIEVCAYEYKPGKESLLEGVEHCTTTGAGGEYAIAGLPPGEYVVEFTEAEGALDYVTQYYSAKASFSEATRVSLPALTTKYGIDAELSLGGRISGEASNLSTGAPIEGILVCAFMPNSEVGECAVTDSAGEYTIAALPVGQYVVEFIGEPGSYLTQYYDGGYAVSEAQLVPVAVEATTAGIDAAMRSGAFKAPVALTPPTVSGTAAVAGTLSCASGSWSANPPPSFSYVWLRDGTPIASATQSAYTVQAADVGQGLACEVEALNSAGSRKGVGRAVSSPVAIVEGSPGGAAGGSPSVTTSSAASASPVLVLETSRIHVSKGHAAQVRVHCEHASCRGSLELVAQTAGRAILARGSFALAEGQTATVTLRFTAAGVRQLAHARAHRLSARLTVLVRGAKTTTEMTVVG